MRCLMCLLGYLCVLVVAGTYSGFQDPRRGREARGVRDMRMLVGLDYARCKKSSFRGKEAVVGPSRMRLVGAKYMPWQLVAGMVLPSRVQR